MKYRKITYCIFYLFGAKGQNIGQILQFSNYSIMKVRFSVHFEE